ncbi:transferrin receptor protein 2-like [Corvus cornix cornix]|uniref:transferrin receptor protein 2-like n=1 Tax=Corvus cornix cornix TaxID=932674 RepID=UPI00195135D8|nr:transferrin receptor protein 2-like [Corvus cornix cornix]
METLRRCFRARPPGGVPCPIPAQGPPGENEEEERRRRSQRCSCPGPAPGPAPGASHAPSHASGSTPWPLWPWVQPRLPAGAVGGWDWPRPVWGRGCRGGASGWRLHPRWCLGRGQRRGSAPRPRLRELLRRHLVEERVEAWVREVSAGPHRAGSGRGRALAQSVLSALAEAGLTQAWSRPQPLPLPIRGEVTLRWVGPEGDELERLPLDPDAFCAWSAPGNATGGLVYGHYGRPQDLAQLRARGSQPGVT